MFSPVLVTAPVETVVGLADLKAHLRVDHDDDDALIAALERAATAYLDGWRGILGRGIMPQTWSQDFEDWGEYTLAFPDVGEVSAVGFVDGVETEATTLTRKNLTSGVQITVDGAPADLVRITYEISLPDEQLPAVQMAVKLLVGHWYEHREAATETPLSAAPMAVQSLVAPLRYAST